MRLSLFWSMVSAIDRLKAEEDLARIDIAIVTNSMSGGGEALNTLRQNLMDKLGTPVRQELPRSGRSDILAIMNEV